MDDTLLLQEGLDGAAGSLLPLQEPAVELGGFFLHLLQNGNAFPCYAQRFRKGFARGGRNDWRLGDGGRPGSRLRQDRCRCSGLWRNRRTLFLGLHIVGPADRDGEGGLFAGSRCRRPIPRIPGGQADVVSEHRQLGQSPGQVGNAVTLAGRCIDGKGKVVAVAEDRLHQPGQARSRPDLQKGANPGGIERLDLGDEFHRHGELFCQELPGSVRISRIGGSGAVGIDGQPGLVQFDLCQGGQKGRGCVGDQRAVEGGGNRQALAGELSRGKDSCCTLDFTAAPGQDGLGRGIAIGDHQVEPFFSQDLLDQRQRGRDGQHAPLVATTCGHELAAQAGKRMEGGFVEPARSAEGGQFTIAMACHGIGPDAKGLQQAERTEADGADGGLGAVGGAQRLFLTFPHGSVECRGGVDQVGEPGAVRGRVICIGCGDGGEYLGEAAGEVAQHAGVLGSLAGKEHAEAVRRAARGKIGAIGCLPWTVRVFPQHGQGIGGERLQVGPFAFHHQRQAAAGAGDGCCSARCGPGTEFGPCHVG